MPCKNSSPQWVDSITLFPPREFFVGLTDLPLHFRELVLAEGHDYGGDMFNLLLDSTRPILESLFIRNTFDPGNRSFSNLVRVLIPHHDGNLTRFNRHIQKLPDPSQVKYGRHHTTGCSRASTIKPHSFKPARLLSPVK